MKAARSITSDFLSGANSLKPFYAQALNNLDFGQAMANKSFTDAARKTLVDVLTLQYEGLSVSSKTQQNIRALASANTFTVTTGHQLGLMGGALFTVYKVLSVIRLCEELAKKHPEAHFVPLFWIHTEDHDFAEINHYYPDFLTQKTYTAHFEGPVGKHILDPEIEALIPDNFTGSLTAAFAAGKTLAQAFRDWAIALFDEMGLLILDPNQAQLKAQFVEVMQAEVLSNTSLLAVKQTTSELIQAGYAQQIEPREINLFYMTDKLRGRIVKVGDFYEVLGSFHRFTQASLLEWMRSNPDSFSPNVCLRPLFQELILPNLAYIGGWGELSYWVQLKGVFEAHGVAFPVLLPRFSATIFTQSQANEFQQLGFELPDIRQSLTQLNQQLENTRLDLSHYNDLAHKLHLMWSAIADASQEHELQRSALSFQTKNEHLLRSLRKKWIREMRKKSPDFAQLTQLKQAISPDGLVQERVWSLAAIPTDIPNFIAQVKAKCQPLDFTHQAIVV